MERMTDERLAEIRAEFDEIKEFQVGLLGRWYIPNGDIIYEQHDALLAERHYATTLEAERDELREALRSVDAMLDICSITFDPDELAETVAERDIQIKDAWGRCRKVYDVMALISAALDSRATYHTKGEK